MARATGHLRDIGDVGNQCGHCLLRAWFRVRQESELAIAGLQNII
jgi:bacterioferritin-associated ferredoxin